MNEKEFIEKWEKRELQSGESIYQDYAPIELPSRTLKGSSQTYATYDKMLSVLDFRDKKVVEFGCHYGYFLFKAKEKGAAECIGLEANRETVLIDRDLAEIKNSNVQFRHFKLGKNNCEEERDITLCCNMLHYIFGEELDFALKTLFSNTNEVFFEIINEQKQAVLDAAKQYGFILNKTIDGRTGRIIYYFVKGKQ